MSSQQDQGVYHEKVRSMVSESQSRLIVNINDLRRKNEKRAKESVTPLRFCKNRKYYVFFIGWVAARVFLLMSICQAFESFGFNKIYSSISQHFVFSRMVLICVFNRLLKNAFSELVAFQRALKDLVASIDATYAKQFDEFHIGFEGSFGNKHVSPRTLSARFLGNLVCVEGIVTKCK